MLSRMAFDVLACTAMSAEVERPFSSTGLIIVERRARELPSVIEKDQLLKVQIKASLITLRLSETSVTSTIASRTIASKPETIKFSSRVIKLSSQFRPIWSSNQPFKLKCPARTCMTDSPNSL
jgi:hypothetical protein